MNIAYSKCTILMKYNLVVFVFTNILFFVEVLAIWLGVP